MLELRVPHARCAPGRRRGDGANRQAACG